MMTRKDYETVAWIVGAARKAVTRTGDNHVLSQFDAMFLPMVYKELKDNNPKFDEQKFIHAAGLEGCAP